MTMGSTDSTTLWLIVFLVACVLILALRALRAKALELGRAHVEIPELLSRDVRRVAQIDLVRHFSSYNPRAVQIAPLPPIEWRSINSPISYRGWVGTPFGQLEDVVRILEDFDAIYTLPTLTQYEIEYPISAPVKPPQIAGPPTLKIAKFELPTPTYTSPLLPKKFFLFSEFVRAQNAPVLKAYEQAVLRREQMERDNAANAQELIEAQKQATARMASAQSLQDAYYENAVVHWKTAKLMWEVARDEEREAVTSRVEQMRSHNLLKRLDAVLENSFLPICVPREWSASYDKDTRIIILEHQFPDLSAVEWGKTVKTRTGASRKPLTKPEMSRVWRTFHQALCLRLTSEIARVDFNSEVDAMVVNGWCRHTVPSTGQETTIYCATLMATRDEVLALRLSDLDASKAFAALKGLASPSNELVAVSPAVRIDMHDTRFVENRNVISALPSEENLACMDWEDFEHLCRELFERVFATAANALVRITQASRDQGVDAIVFDPDPVRGGKLVIQAKRYTNTVDVSAVRDLYGSILNEGAMKGILVTTSKFGPDAYEFIRNKPISLIDGAELLGLLESHGYKFRIDLAEAKRRNAASNMR